MLKKYKNALYEAIKHESLSPADFWVEETIVTILLSKIISHKKEVPAPKKSPFANFLSNLFPSSKTNYFESSPKSAVKRSKSSKILSSKTVEADIFKITLKNSDLHFSVTGGEGLYSNFAYSFSNFGSENYSSWWRDSVDFTQLQSRFHVWLKDEVKEYIKERDLPDYWAEFKDSNPFPESLNITPQTQSDFTEDEKTEVRESIKRLRQLIEEEFQPTAEQAEYLDTRLDYLSESLERLNRFDWHGVAVSTFIGIAINLTVDTERGKALFALVQTAFKSVVHLLQ